MLSTVNKVYLVGAGPGDPGLLTRRAVELLSSADVVAYDALISPSILAWVNPEAELIPVGHRGYETLSQNYRLHPVVLERWREGKMVVRLKSGDPFIFGRGAQECEELLGQEIPFEVVPGVTSALGAAAYAGFPLTHRKFASDVLITSGHDLRGGSPSQSDWQALAKSCGTLVIYMAGSKVRENCQRLIEMGRSHDTPAAFISEATRGCQNVILGTLGSLHEKVGEVSKKNPALIVVGKVVQLRQQFSWLEKKPLHGLTLLLARARPGLSRLAHRLREEGSDVIEVPWIKPQKLDDYLECDEILKNFSRYSALIFSCMTGVDFFFARLLKSGMDLRSLRGLTIIAVGKDVQEKLAQYAIISDIFLAGNCLKAWEEKKEQFKAGFHLVITSDQERNHLKAFIRHLGLQATFLPVYRVRHQFPNFNPPKVDFVLLPSSTSAKLLLDGPWGLSYKEIPMIALGPLAKKEALELGAVEVHVTDEDRPEAVIPLLIQLKKREPVYART